MASIALTAALLPAQDQPRTISAASSSAAAAKSLPVGITRVALVFSGGHDVVPVDHGRPVALIAAALGVKDEVFREAFTHVRPAGPGSGGPTDTEARANKQVLMKALGKYGVTNDRLNEVSNFYRYPPGRGSLWKNQPAKGNALVKEGVIVGYEITSGGYGYTTPPSFTVPNFAGPAAKVRLTFGPTSPPTARWRTSRSHRVTDRLASPRAGKTRRLERALLCVLPIFKHA